jgi:hypothetical protein
MALSSTHQSAPTFHVPPEVLQQIFSCFDEDNASLFAFIQVSKACCSCCIGMLWRKSSQRRLAKISTPERRQHYANLIYRWDFNDNPSWEVFDRLDFPLLKDLSFSGGSLSVEQLRRCLQAGLHTLRYAQCFLDAANLEMMIPSCTQLQRLIIMGADTSGITPDQFMTFL